MFSCYVKLERRQSIKKDGAISKTPRYVVTVKAGYFKPLTAIKNADGEIVMYYQSNKDCNQNSKSETRLQCKGSINFSSVYLDGLKIGEMLIGYGEPQRGKMLKPQKGKGGKMIERENPFFENQEDGYLFLISPDEKTIEILIVPQGRMLIQGYAKMLADGKLNEVLNTLRKSAK